MDFDRDWTMTLTDMHGDWLRVSRASGPGFRWDSPTMTRRVFGDAVAAARDLLAFYGHRVTWQNGETALRICRDYDLAREAREAA